MSAEDFESLCSQARVAVQDRELDEAVRLFHAALKLSPDAIDVHEGLATAYVLKEDYTQAILHFEQVTLLSPRDPKAYINLGALYNLQQDFKSAALVLRKAVQRNSKSADAYYNLGIAEKGQQQLALAMSAYKECIKLRPEMPEAHVNLANCYVEQTNYKKAIEHYEIALRHRPDFGSARRGVAHAKSLMSQAKQEAAPFGRLVDTKKLDRQATAVTQARVLTEDERFEDRQFLTLELEQTRDFTDKFRLHIRDYLEPALLKINRVLTQDAGNRGAVLDAHDEFHEAWKFARAIYDRLDDSRLALKEHEYDMQPT